ncbi:MAG: PAS domain-containing protein, partial [Lachnospiraceae bacterium]|nr:PAS domain-containing protein [Lachnospiraceae bacterium]
MNNADYFKEILTHSLFFEFVTDQELYFVYANQLFYDCFGYDEANLINTRLYNIIPPIDHHQIDQLRLETKTSGLSGTAFVPFITNDGKTIDIYLHCRFTKDQKHLIWSMSDVQLLTSSERTLISRLNQAR